MKRFSNELVCNILDYIKKNLFDEIKIDVFTSTFYFNRTYIIKKFKKEIGISIINYLNMERIYESLKYFKDDKSILEIALKNGFNSQEYYCEIFKKIMGVSPIIYKKYLNRFQRINNNKIEIIQKHLLEIEDVHIRVKQYLDNRKPIQKVKKLSLYN